jgi:hypothetical protein
MAVALFSLHRPGAAQATREPFHPAGWVYEDYSRRWVPKVAQVAVLWNPKNPGGVFEAREGRPTGAWMSRPRVPHLEQAS